MPARLVLTLVLAISAEPAQRAQDPFDAFEPDAQTKAVRAAIAAELKGLPAHPWAGHYGRGGLGGSAGLEVAPRAGFVFTAGSCLDTSWSHGSVTQQDLRLRLKDAPGSSSAGEQPVEDVLLPVRWGQRHYLLFADEIRPFCSYVAANLGDQTIDGLYYVREGDKELPSFGQPRTLNGALLCEASGAGPD